MTSKKQAGSNKFVSRFYLNNILVTEKIEAASWLRFFYLNRPGTFMRRLFRKPWWSKLYGAYKNSKISKRNIQQFVQKHQITMDDFERPVEQYSSFNDFFCRKLKPGARPINQDQSVIVSPADGKLLVFERITQEMKFFVKTLPFNLECFLQSKKLAEQYEHGTMMIFRLAPYDYHRYHFPVDCLAQKAQIIGGHYESVNPLVYTTGVQPLTSNKRDLLVLETKVVGQMLMIPVGAMCAGKIVNTYQPNQSYKKGDEAGYFAFGGSTIVLLFRPGTIQLIEPFVTHSQEGFETAVKMGEAVALRS